MDRIVMVRRQIASEPGHLIPFVRVRDNFAGMGRTSTASTCAGSTYGSGVVYPDRLMAMEGPGVTQKVTGIPGKEPCVWIGRGLGAQGEQG
jgi:flagellar biosynthesis protein FlhA